MKYMLLIYGKENCWTEDERRECMAESMGIGGQLAARGKYFDSAPLQSVTTASTVRVRGGQTLVTDGPFAETVEQLGGFYVLDLADLDEAISVATRLPPVSKGTVEIRPMLDIDGLPPARPHTADPGATLYMLLSYDDPAIWQKSSEAAMAAAKAEAAAHARELHAAGAYVSASPLHAATAATCVRVRDGKRTITDGPFAETNEVLGGYYLIRPADREAALRAAARHAAIANATVEVRPLYDLSAVRQALANS